MDVPGKASTIALIDTIEPPIVKLNDGTVLQINNKEQAHDLKNQIEKDIISWRYINQLWRLFRK